EGAPSIDASGNYYYTSSAIPEMISRGVIGPEGVVQGATPLFGTPRLAQIGGITYGNMDIGVAPFQPYAVLSRAAWAGGSSAPIAADLWYLRRWTPAFVTHDPNDTAYFLGALNTT